MEGCLIIGYFAIRAKAQVCRLLCQYLGLPYKDQFFTPEEWENFQQNEAKDWVIKKLPFLKDGNFIVTGQHGITEYIIRKSNKISLFGSFLKDRIAIDMFKSKYDIKDNIIGLICMLNRKNSKQMPQHEPQYYWETKIRPRLQDIERTCIDNDWCFGYLTVLDFSYYEMMNNIESLFPDLVKNYPKLMKLRDKVKSLEAIQAYQNSNRAVKDLNPVSFFRDFQKKKQQDSRIKLESEQK